MSNIDDLFNFAVECVIRLRDTAEDCGFPSAFDNGLGSHLILDLIAVTTSDTRLRQLAIACNNDSRDLSVYRTGDVVDDDSGTAGAAADEAAEWTTASRRRG